MNQPAPQAYDLTQANYRQLLDYGPNVAILPWGATEAHNYHLPHGTDMMQAHQIALESARKSLGLDAKPIVLPPIPFGNNAQQLDQVATVHISSDTAKSILSDVAMSLVEQGIDRLIVLNAHGGNEFKPMVRDVQLEQGLLIVVVNFWQVASDKMLEIFDEPGDHAGELETSLLLHLCPELVVLEQAGPGEKIPFAIREIAETDGVWTPRPWSAVHPDTGAGNPEKSTAEKGATYFTLITDEISKLIAGLSKAVPGDTPYC